MALFEGFGLFSSSALSQENLDLSKQLAFDTRAWAETHELESVRKHIDLPDGGYAYSIKHGDILRVFMHPGAPPDPHIFPGATPTRAADVPDFLSGGISDGVMRPLLQPPVPPATTGQKLFTLQAFWPTGFTQKRVKIPGGKQSSRRLSVEPNPSRPDLMAPPPPSDKFKYSQYVKLRSSMYSGKMKQVAQFVMGYGRLTPKSAFNGLMRDKALEAGRAAAAPSAFAARAYGELGVDFEYDYTFYRTHGIATASDGKLFVVEVSTRGVLAMALPYWPKTTSQKFLDKLTDPEAIYVCEELGGFPSGEPIPPGPKLLAAMKRAGDVLELAPVSDLANFYQMTPQSSGCGWAFNERGSEAHNCAMRSGDDGLYTSEHWHVQFKIGAEKDPVANRPVMLAAFAKYKLPRADGGLALRDAVLRKINWLGNSDADAIYELLGRGLKAEAFKLLDSIEVVRTTFSSSKLKMASKGIIYWGTTRSAPPIKWHEPMLGFLMSPEWTREGLNPNWSGVPDVIDATVHVYFNGDALKVVKYFLDRSNKATTTADVDPVECEARDPYNGTFRTNSTGVGSLFYGTDFDYRVEGYEQVTTVKTLVTYEGHGGLAISDHIDWPAHASVWRTHYFKHVRRTDTTGNETTATAVIIPGFVREGLQVARSIVRSTSSWSLTHTRRTAADAYFYETGRYLGWWPRNGVQEKCGKPNGIRRVALEFYQGDNPCTVDQGPYLGICDQVTEQDSVPRAGLPESTGEARTSSGELLVSLDFPPLGNFASNFTQSWKQGESTPYLPWQLWFEKSPSNEGLEQYCSVTWNCFGEANLITGQVGPNGIHPPLFRGVPSNDAFKGAAVTFIGVVNGI